MADYLILKKDPERVEPTAWQVVNISREKNADEAGARAALDESYDGPGKYGVVRVDNARTATVTESPSVTEDEASEF